MKYDLSQNDRFFLNHLIPKWDSGKPFDLYGDLKYVFHREKGTNYNPAQFEYTLKTLSAFLSDHGFARENPAKINTFTLLPKGNMLLVKGTVEQFELYQDQKTASHQAIITPPREPRAERPRPEVYIPNQQEGRRSGPFSFFRILIILGILAAIAWYFMNKGE